MRILVVEDEEELRDVLAKQLKEHGYSVDSCADGQEAEDYLEASEYDIVILDILLPKRSGIQVLEWIRKRGISVQVLMLSALDSVGDKVAGLDAGADDYMTKPFAFEELLARIRLLTRKKAGNRTNVYQALDLVMDVTRRRVYRSGKEITLSNREFALLEYMIANPDAVLTRSQIEQHILDYSYEGSSNMVDVYIRYLRKKIDEDHEKKLIRTVRGHGYMLCTDG